MKSHSRMAHPATSHSFTVVATSNCVLSGCYGDPLTSLITFQAAEGAKHRQFRFRFRLNVLNLRPKLRSGENHCCWRHLRKWISSPDTYFTFSAKTTAVRTTVKSRRIYGRVLRWRIRFCLRCSMITRGLL